MEEFDKMTDQFKAKESEIAQMAIKQYGSIEKYTEAMKKSLNSFPDSMEQLNMLKDSDDYIRQTTEITKKLTSDLNKEVSSEEVRQIVDEWVNFVNENTPKSMDMGDNFWNLAAEGYLSEPAIIEVTDRTYGNGASVFIGKALKSYLE